MLVLSRKANRQIVVGENMELVVVAVSRDPVKLGFNARSEVRIYREEVHRRVESENGGASSTLAGLAEAKMVLADLRQTED